MFEYLPLETPATKYREGARHYVRERPVSSQCRRMDRHPLSSGRYRDTQVVEGQVSDGDARREWVNENEVFTGEKPRTVIELGRLPDANLSPNKRLHYMELYRAKAAAKQAAAALVMAQGKPSRPYEKAHITITWVAKDKRRRDSDNLLSSMKSYLDGLVAVGLLVDDDATHVGYTLRYERGEKDNTIIEVEEV